MENEDIFQIKSLISDLYFDYERLTEGGQDTLDKIYDILEMDEDEYSVGD
jgi:hypothetical protein